MNTECAICFELVRFTDTQTPIATRCGHIFHDNCINQYLGDVSDDSLRVCPQCNQFTKQSELIQLFRTAPGVFIRKQKLVIEQYRRNLRAMKENSRLQKELIKTLRSTIKIQNLQKGRPLVNTNPHTGTEEIEQQLRSLNLPNSSMPQHSSPMEPHTFIRKLVEAAYPPVKAFRSKNRRKDEAHRGNVRSSTVVSDKNLQDEKP
ncbi:E3 ubiquitin-protein ligase RFWD3, partial [Pseudolycoriella hygida]